MGKDKEEKKAKKEKKEEKADSEIKKEKKEKKEKKVKAEAEVPEDDKAAKKAKKAAKKAAEAAAAAAPPPEDEKAAKKAKKAAKRAAEEAAAAEEVPAKKAKKEKKEEEEAPAAAAPTGDEQVRVYVANLPFSVDDTSIQATFAACGTITGTDWLSHSDTGRFKGAGFLTFETGAAAAAAVLLNGQDNGGRPMKVEIAAARAEKKTWEAEDLGEPSASLFLGNLSWSIDEDSIRKLFEGCGEIQRIKWHEREGQFTGKAFLDFDSVDSATKAAAKSGQDLKGRPVRITFSKGGNGGAAGGKGAGASGRVERPYKPEGAKPDGCVELFCGNLPWSIDDDKITDFFKDCGTVTATRWLNDKETGDFKGVGWVTFSSTEEVDKAVEMGGEQLDGRPIRIDYAGQKKAAAAWGGGGSW